MKIRHFFKRVKIFFNLLLHQLPPTSLQNACYHRPLRAWRSSRLVNGEVAMYLFECSFCDGTGTVVETCCPRCKGKGILTQINPGIFTPVVERWVGQGNDRP